MNFFDPGTTGIPKCPNQTKLTTVFSYPVLSLTFLALSIFSLFFAIITGWKYNSVLVYIE